jgi:hypothetical protein
LLVDLSQSSLNSLAGIVAQMEAVHEAIGNDINHLARIMREGLKSESHLCYKHVV